MISPEYAHMMARYNRWQNVSIYTAANTLDDAARRQDRGAFFGSIHGTLSHLLWGDTIWMSRFDAWDAPAMGIPDSVDFAPDWAEMCEQRITCDAKMINWAGGLTPADLIGDLSWFSQVLGQEISKPRDLLIVHIFNHQTHHRGQVHAMLTAAGAKPDDTDLPFMKD